MFQSSDASSITYAMSARSLLRLFALLFDLSCS